MTSKTALCISRRNTPISSTTKIPCALECSNFQKTSLFGDHWWYCSAAKGRDVQKRGPCLSAQVGGVNVTTDAAGAVHHHWGVRRHALQIRRQRRISGGVRRCLVEVVLHACAQGSLIYLLQCNAEVGAVLSPKRAASRLEGRSDFLTCHALCGQRPLHAPPM